MALCGGEPKETLPDGVPDRFEQAVPGRPQDRLRLREAQFNRIDAWTVFRQKPEVRADGFDRLTHSRALIAGEIVEYDEVAGRQRGREHLLDVDSETRAINRPIEHRGRGQAVQPLARK